MKTLFGPALALAGVLVFSTARAAPEEPTVTKTFAVTPGGELSVATDAGTIEVQSAPDNQAVIVVERTAKSANASELEDLLKHNHVKFSQEGNHVSVEVHNDRVSRGWFSSPRGHLEVRIKVTLPRRFNADLATDGGNISAAELQGTVNARSSGGNIEFSKIQGVADGGTSGGNLTAAGCSDRLTLQTSGGNVSVQDFSGPNAQIDSSGGNISVTRCQGGLQAKTSGGNIAVENFSGPKAFLDTSGGAVSADLEKSPAGECWFRSSGGNISVKLPPDIAADLNASTDGGRVVSDLPVTVEGKMQEGKLVGKINGGGPLLMLKTSGGNIRVLKR